MTFLLSEDGALRTQLEGMVVYDQKADGTDSPRPVGVWFGMPDSEIRTQNYPYITIDMIDIAKDNMREMRGEVTASYAPYLFSTSPAEDQEFKAELPIPVNIDYQVTTYSRHPRHDRQILAQLLGGKLPLRYGTLHTDDNTVRRLDVLDVAKRDAVESGKRLFMNAITIRVSSELPLDLYTQLYKVGSVHVDTLTEENAGGRPGAPYYSSLGPTIIS